MLIQDITEHCEIRGTKGLQEVTARIKPSAPMLREAFSTFDLKMHANIMLKYYYGMKLLSLIYYQVEFGK